MEARIDFTEKVYEAAGVDPEPGDIIDWEVNTAAATSAATHTWGANPPPPAHKNTNAAPNTRAPARLAGLISLLKLGPETDKKAKIAIIEGACGVEIFSWSCSTSLTAL